MAGFLRPGTTRVTQHVQRRWTDLIVVTRQAAATLAPARRVVLPPLGQIAAVVVASLFVGFGAAAFVRAGRGVPPYDVLLLGLADLVDVSHGQASWLVGGVLFAVATALGRRPGPVALAWVVANGVTVDVFSHVLVDADSLGSEIGLLTVGTISIALGIAAFVHATASGGPYELIMLAMADRGRSATGTRIALDVAVVAAGLSLSGPYGPASLIYPFLMGPILGLSLQAFEDLRRGRQLRLAHR